MELGTMRKKIDILEHAFAASAGAYYNINLTQNLVPGSMYQVIDDKEYSVNEQMGLPENARFTDVVSFWGEKLEKKEQQAYYEFLSIPKLLEHYHQGEFNINHTYWTKSVLHEPMLAQQHIMMYEDEKTGDILAITYLQDMTQKFREEEYEKKLVQKQQKLEAALEEAEKVKQYKEIQTTVEAVDDILNKLTFFDKISSEEELNQIMPDLMASLGRYSMSDRAYVFTWNSQKHQILHMTHEWCAEGILPTIEKMQELKMSDMPNWSPKLNKGESIICADWDAEKEKTPEEYAVFDGQDIHSLIVIPIFAQNKLNGYIGFDNPEQSRAALSVRLLSSIGGHISSLKDNFFMMEELEKKQGILKNNLDEMSIEKQKLEQAVNQANLNNEIINSISKLYWLIYRMDLVRGTYEEISAGDEMHTLTGKNGNTEAMLKEARETIVSLEYQNQMKTFLDTSTLDERLRDTESISMEYRAVGGAWHQARFIVKKRNTSGNVTNVLYVVRRIDREKQTEIQLQQERIENNRVLFGLRRDYTIAFIVNLDTDDYKIVFAQKTNHAKAEKNILKFTEYVSKYTDEFVLPPFKENMRKEMNSAFMKKRFETENEYYFSFETIPNAAGLSCFQAHIVKEYEGNEHFAFLGVRSVDEAVKQERFYKDALRKANEALREQLDRITHALPGGVKISNDDETYSFKYVSEQFAHMLGYVSPDELIEASGGNIVGLAHPDDIKTGIAEALEQYKEADYYEITYRMRCKNGSWKYIEDRGHKIYNQDGVVEHWNLILDKNELIEKTIALESEKKISKGKSEFLSRMSHDMRTPLNGIIGLLDICIRHPEDRELIDSSRLKARVAAEHLLTLVNDSLELSKLENVGIPLKKETFTAPDLLHEVETIAQMKADEMNVGIRYQYDVNKLKYPHLQGSPLYVKQILLNLITNGIKYNKENGSVFCNLEENELSDTQITWHITISDTGIGMSADFLKDIFKPFVQADSGARTNYNGSGLGMAIVKNLLERMNGTIEIDSKEGVGTTMNVVIPFEIVQETEPEEIPEKSSGNNLNGLHILLAEDNELNREIATFVLEEEKIVVTQAVDGQHALSLFQKKPEYYYDAVLMDIMMPNMDGYQATKAIRNCKRKDAGTIPIIAMTANAFEEDKRKAKAAGMNAHLAKPLNVPELMDTIGELCKRKI